MTRAHEAAIYLVRHGESTWNAQGRCQGQSTEAGGLTENGRAQAAQTAGELVATLDTVAPTIVASDLPRARQTAEIIAAELGLPIEFDAQLREQDLGQLQGHLYTDPFDGTSVQETINELWRDPFIRPPGGESVADMYQRVQRALQRHATRFADAPLVVVTHGGVVRTASAGDPPRPGVAVPHTTVDNASITTWSTPCPVP